MRSSIRRVAFIFTLVSILMVSMLPVTAKAAGERTMISQLQVTSDFINAITIGGDINGANVNSSVTDSRVRVNKIMWSKFDKTVGYYKTQFSGNFTPGEWKCMVGLEIINPSAYVFADPGDMKVVMNGREYSYNDFNSFGGRYDDNGVWLEKMNFSVISPTITIGSNGFKFYQNEFYVPESIVNSAITPINLGGSLLGGNGTFTKVSGPAWINVSSTGQITGTPTAAASSNVDLVVNVSDKSGNTATATLSVGATQAAGTKNKITKIRATSNISAITIEGHKVEVPTFTTTQGSPAIVETSVETSGEFQGTCWYQKIGNSTYSYMGYDSDEGFVNEFRPGEYILYVHVIIPASYTSTYEFADAKDMDVLIDGQEWTYVNTFKDYGDGTSRYVIKRTDITVPRLVKSITLSQATLDLHLNDTANLSVEVLPNNAANKNVYWESSDTSIASVDNDGRVKTYGNTGTATITVYADDGSGVSATCVVTVTTVQEEPRVEDPDKTDKDSPNKPKEPTDPVIFDEGKPGTGSESDSGSVKSTEEATDTEQATPVDSNESTGGKSDGNSGADTQANSNQGTGTETSGVPETAIQDNPTQDTGSASESKIDKKQKNASFSKVKAGKKSIKLSWKKVKAKGIKGYEIQCSTDKKFKNDVKIVTIKKTKTTSTTIKKLKSKKKYFIRIRTFKKSGAEKIYSKWSKTKSVKVK